MLTCPTVCDNMHVPLIITDDRPGLTQLQHLQTGDKKPIRLLQDIEPRYAVFGTCLLADENGVKMSTIKSDHNSVEERTTAIFSQFLRGEILWLSQTCIVTSVGRGIKVLTLKF